MIFHLRACLVLLLSTLLLCSVLYPLVLLGVGKLAFPRKAEGSLVTVKGTDGRERVVGSELLAQPFTDDEYFQPRPSQTDYSATGTFFSNRGPNSAVGRFFFRDALAAYLDLERKYDPRLTAAKVPVDAVTTSGSGVDPHISKANARIQAHRIAAVRGLPLDRVNELIDQHTDGRFLGVIGEPGVNVLELNLALDKEAPAR